jgi:hypothetical protein
VLLQLAPSPAGPAGQSRAGRLSFPGWAGVPRPGSVGCASAKPALQWAGVAPQAGVGPGQLSRAGRDFESSWATFAYCSGRARSGFPWPRPDYLSPGRINLLWAEIHLLRHVLLIRHRLQRLVLVLGRLQARTGTSSIVICWSWDAPWLRPAYSSSPS